ncbi:TonB-dependent receptor [Barnesiella propionica]|uniref:TonB-dependent receptor plug domain-containing protein n=1 Tax=Barnesiella propionica TaxID=2981781 RepID=UPI0011CBE0DA|nr:TonB-dependent receptor [Barnesiella propionica]MCU6768167.1 TonB-dependent receptor [Barnesiella propionica]
MQKRFIILLFIFSVNIFNITSKAGVRDTLQIDEVTVTATKYKEDKNNTPLTISVIDRKVIDESSESALLPILSQRVPGLFVTQRGITGFGISTGSAGMVNIRGVGQGNKVLTLFDGQPQWAGVFGHALPDTYVSGEVERVEVVRGPASLLYGSNAMGGVINIITRNQDKEGVSAEANMMAGSYGTQKYMINSGIKQGKFKAFITVNHDRTDGHRKNSRFHLTNEFFNLQYEINKFLKTSAYVALTQSKGYNPGADFNPLIDNWADMKRGTASFSMENTGATASGALRAFYNWGHHKINDGYAANGGRPQSYLFYSDDHNAGILLYQNFNLWTGNDLTAGIDYKNWGGKAWNDSINGNKATLVNKSIDEIAGYVIMQQKLWDKLYLNAGVRYEYNDQFGGEWIPQAGIIYHPVEGNTLKASFSKGYRSPNLRELYMFKPANPDLNPEYMYNYEISAGQFFLDRKLYTALTLFWIDGKNMIETVREDGRPQNRNTGSFVNKGYEIEAAYNISSMWNVDMNYSYLHSNKILQAAPKHKLFAAVIFNLRGFSATVNVQSIFDMYTVGENPREVDFTLLNARLAYQWKLKHNIRMTVFAKGENLTGHIYSINEGFPMPGAIFMGGVNFKI